MAPLIIVLVLLFTGAFPPEDAAAVRAFQAEELRVLNGPYSTVLSEGTVRVLVERFFPESEWDKAVAVAWCESRFDAAAENPRSSAGGLFQFLDRTWVSVGGGDKHDPVASTRNAAVLWGQSRSWAAWSCG